MVWWEDKDDFIAEESFLGPGRRVKYKKCRTRFGESMNNCKDNAPPGTIGFVRCAAGRNSFGSGCHDKIDSSSLVSGKFPCYKTTSCFAIQRVDQGCSSNMCDSDYTAICPYTDNPFNGECAGWTTNGVQTNPIPEKYHNTIRNYCSKGDNIENDPKCAVDLRNNSPSIFKTIADAYCNISNNILKKKTCDSSLKAIDRGGYDSKLSTYCTANPNVPECGCWLPETEDEKKIKSVAFGGSYVNECHRAACTASSAKKTRGMEIAGSNCPSIQVCFQNIGVDGDVGENATFTNIEAKCDQTQENEISTTNTTNTTNTNTTNTTEESTTVAVETESIFDNVINYYKSLSPNDQIIAAVVVIVIILMIVRR